MLVCWWRRRRLWLRWLRCREKVHKSLAEQAGYSLGKVNFILNALIDKGLIKAERFAASDRKARYRYILTPKGLSEKMRLLEKFVERKRVEYEELAAELERMKKSERTEN